MVAATTAEATQVVGALLILALVAATTAEATQVVGALLILGLLAAPASAATRLTTRPLHALALSTTIAVASVWIA